MIRLFRLNEEGGVRADFKRICKGEGHRTSSGEGSGDGAEWCEIGVRIRGRIGTLTPRQANNLRDRDRDPLRDWHRWFGLCWEDFFTGLPVSVTTEKDLSVKQQWLDLVIIRNSMEPLPRQPPDGFEELAAHNLVSFKSFQETLDGWALQE
jgi:hypothetical protein